MEAGAEQKFLMYQYSKNSDYKQRKIHALIC